MVFSQSTPKTAKAVTGRPRTLTPVIKNGKRKLNLGSRGPLRRQAGSAALAFNVRHCFLSYIPIMKYIPKSHVFVAAILSAPFVSSVAAFDGIVLKCSLRFSNLPPDAPAFTSWEVMIPPSGNAAFVRTSTNNESSSLIYRGALNKISFEGVNDQGIKMSIRRKDGQIEVKDGGAQSGFLGSCDRGQANDVF